MPTNFDDMARTWDEDPEKVGRARVIAGAIHRAARLGPTTRLLEYGAGTGLVSEALAGEVGGLTMVEPSAGMRAVIADKVAAGRLPDDARVWALDLAADAVPAERFDCIATVMTLHHVPDVPRVLRGFAALLVEGGRLCVADLEEEDGSFHSDDPAFDGHHGFDRGALTEMLRDAGFADVAFDRCHEIEREGRRYPVFLATAAKLDGR